MVLRKIEAMGVNFVTRAKVKTIATEPGDGKPKFSGFEMDDGSVFKSDMVVCAVGIRGRDELAKTSGIVCEPKGGIRVDDDLRTSADGVYAIGECASWRGNTYGLIAPGIEMADSASSLLLTERGLTPSTVLSFNFTQTSTELGSHAPRKMNDPDLSCKLKLMGVDVASFGDFFADNDPTRSLDYHARKKAEKQLDDASKTAKPEVVIGEGESEKTMKKDEAIKVSVEEVTELTKSGTQTPKKGGHKPRVFKDEPIKCLTYKDPFGSVYKKCVRHFPSADRS